MGVQRSPCGTHGQEVQLALGRPALLSPSPGPCPKAYSLLWGSILGVDRECDERFHCSCCGHGGRHLGSRPRHRATGKCYNRYRTSISKCVQYSTVCQ